MEPSIYDLGFLEQWTTGADQSLERWAKPWRLMLQPSDCFIGVDRLSKDMHQMWEKVSSFENEAKNVIGVQKKALQAYQLRQQQTSDEANSFGASPRTGAYSTDHHRLIFVLHRNLDHEYYDLLLAGTYAGTQDDAPNVLKCFCQSRQVPDRLWKYGIQIPLDFWRRRLPASKEYMHAYIVFCYQMLTQLLEAVEDFNRSWMESLGGRSLYFGIGTAY